MRLIVMILLTGLIFLTGCDELGFVIPVDPNAPEFTATFESIEITDSEILRLTYSSYKQPLLFYHEDLQGVSLYYENTVSIGFSGPGEVPWFQLSTDSRDQAREWSEASDANSSVHRVLVAEGETERYFEFRRMSPGNSTIDFLSRVHKLSYLDRSMHDFLKPTPLIGRLNVRPLKELSVKGLAEYLYFIENYQTGGAKALAAVPASASDTVYCALYHLHTVYGDWSLRDQISLQRTVYGVSRTNGDIIRRTHTLRTVQGRMN